ncbi:enoyl-CoA hydratase-related protein [Rhodococcus oxybenzonivorans]|uniref:enoyl-CoA hydratase/isomerase family protein n=1 Tax=Rhodococcus oxybenzonivorans TaxID=1990687 RepID=UPI00295307DA|nr:enoyl-CoA hydratase-related protein [Rhodococcus oxybenzonivorans]MDV7352795.1 enoyl-CoA hydratase-related protein [Rhodococcus oxybenzonivorans]
MTSRSGSVEVKPGGPQCPQVPDEGTRTLDVRVTGSVATVIFNRPDERNGVTTHMVTQMHEELSALSTEDTISVVVLTGAGTTFCPGADLADAAARTASPPSSLPEIAAYQSSTLLHEMPQVTVAAINGGCAGAGLAWAAACDLRIAAADARFTTAFLDVGLPGELGAPWTLSRALGGARARDLCFLPTKFDAAEALRVGFVSRVFPSATFREDAGALTAALGAHDVGTLRTMKQNFLDAERLPLDRYVEVEARRQLDSFVGDARAATLERFALQRDRLSRQNNESNRGQE